MKFQIKSLVVVLALALALIGFMKLQPTNDFPKGKPGAEIEFLIADGELGSSIASKLEAQGVIKSAIKFVEEFTKDPKAQGISPGSHRINKNIPVAQAIAQLLDPKRVNNIVVVSEGSTLSDVVKILKANDHISKANLDFRRVRPVYQNAANSLEGSLFPARYSFEAKTTLAKALESMVSKARSENELNGLNQGYLKFTPFQILTIASMVQIEGDPSNFDKVARVIYNRLKIGMALQLNSTIQYANNSRGNVMLTLKETRINSPFNTYKRVGLPPTPISNPSTAAVKASLNPAPGDWLYFITVAPRDTRFTKDFAEFSKWNTEFNKNVAAGKFK
jgi:UPF0755 protein